MARAHITYRANRKRAPSKRILTGVHEHRFDRATERAVRRSWERQVTGRWNGIDKS